jgi:hypothetical protein
VEPVLRMTRPPEMAGSPRFETFSGQPVVFYDHRLIPFHQTLRLDLPGKHGGLIWNRPASLLVTRPDGSEQVLPIHDPTRRALWFILGVTALFTVLTWLRRH